MPGEFRIEVVQVERSAQGTGRVALRVEVPEGIEGSMVEGELAGFFAKELGSRVGLNVRRVPWGDGIRVRRGESAVVLTGLSAEGQVQLESHARASADECNRDLRPDGAMGSRLHEILRRLGPRR